MRRINRDRIRIAEEQERRTGEYVEPALEPIPNDYMAIRKPEETISDVLDELEILLYDYENKQKNQ